MTAIDAGERNCDVRQLTGDVPIPIDAEAIVAAFRD